MEHAPWRLIIISAACSLALLLGVYLIVLPKRADFETAPIEKILEFKDTYIAGHEDGKKTWEFHTKYGWSGQDRDITTLTGISEGKMYKKNGDLIVKELEAEKVIAYRASKIVEVFGLPEGTTEGKSTLSAIVAFTPKNHSKKYRFADLDADFLRYDPNQKKSFLNGHISLKDPKISLKTDVMQIDHENGIANLTQHVSLKRKDVRLSSNSLDYFSDDEKVVTDGSVEAKIMSKPNPTAIKANQIILFADESKDFSALGSIEARQGKKISIAENALYTKPSKKIILSGHVKTVIEKAKALIKEETAKKLTSEDAKKILKEKTFILSDNLEFKTDNGDAFAYGKVTVSQKGKEAKADSAAYTENNEMIKMSGNVYLKREKEWIKCQGVEISIKNETFSAQGSVEAEFKIKKKD